MKPGCYTGGTTGSNGKEEKETKKANRKCELKKKKKEGIMKKLVLLVVLSLFFVTPCFAGENLPGFCSNAVTTNIVLENPTDINYGWVGIRFINTRIITTSGTQTKLTEVLKYDTQGIVLESKETIFDEQGNIVEITIMTNSYEQNNVIQGVIYTSNSSLSQKWVQQLKPNGHYEAQVTTQMPTAMPISPIEEPLITADADCHVSVSITKLLYVPAKITGTRKNWKFTPAYYKPIDNGIISVLYTAYNFVDLTYNNSQELMDIPIGCDWI